MKPFKDWKFLLARIFGFIGILGLVLLGNKIISFISWGGVPAEDFFAAALNKIFLAVLGIIFAALVLEIFALMKIRDHPVFAALFMLIPGLTGVCYLCSIFYSDINPLEWILIPHILFLGFLVSGVLVVADLFKKE